MPGFCFPDKSVLNSGNSGVRSFFRPTEFYFLVIVVVNSINMGCSGSNKPI